MQTGSTAEGFETLLQQVALTREEEEAADGGAELRSCYQPCIKNMKHRPEKSFAELPEHAHSILALGRLLIGIAELHSPIYDAMMLVDGRLIGL